MTADERRDPEHICGPDCVTEQLEGQLALDPATCEIVEAPA